MDTFYDEVHKIYVLEPYKNNGAFGNSGTMK